MAAAAGNKAEQVQGYSPFQWAYGKGDGNDDLDADEEKHFTGLDTEQAS